MKRELSLGGAVALRNGLLAVAFTLLAGRLHEKLKEVRGVGFRS